jgi:hypothetical protein
LAVVRRNALEDWSHPCKLLSQEDTQTILPEFASSVAAKLGQSK